MSDYKENEFEEIEELEENEDYITLTDDDGNDVSFEILAVVEYKERLFAVLLPFDDEDDEVVILEMLETEIPENYDFVSVEEDSLLNEVFDEFKKNYTGEYDFE